MHPIHRVTSFDVAGTYALSVRFDDGSEQLIDFEPVLHGELLRPLRDRALFARVQLDREAHTLVWPSGADFDPATLHDWPEHAAALAARTAMGTLGQHDHALNRSPHPTLLPLNF